MSAEERSKKQKYLTPMTPTSGARCVPITPLQSILTTMIQFAQYSLAIQEPEQARTSLIKALSYSADHIASLVLLSRFYLLTPSKLPFAEGLLDTLTQNHGWDVAEAWYELSRCYKGTGRERREKECLVWALQLEETRSVRSLRCCPRLL